MKYFLNGVIQLLAWKKNKKTPGALSTEVKQLAETEGEADIPAYIVVSQSDLQVPGLQGKQEARSVTK